MNTQQLKDEREKAKEELIAELKELRECLLSKINVNKLSDSQCRGIDSYNDAISRSDQKIASLTEQINEEEPKYPLNPLRDFTMTERIDHLPDVGNMINESNKTE